MYFLMRENYSVIHLFISDTYFLRQVAEVLTLAEHKNVDFKTPQLEITRSVSKMPFL